MYNDTIDNKYLNNKYENKTNSLYIITCIIMVKSSASNQAETFNQNSSVDIKSSISLHQLFFLNKQSNFHKAKFTPAIYN